MYSNTSTGTARRDYHARLLGHLSNPKRILACILLSQREMTVGSLSIELGLSQSATSQHLAGLFGGGIVQCRADAQFRYYSCKHPGTLRIIKAMWGFFDTTVQGEFGRI